MRLLLDTCTFLWILDDDPALSPAAREAFRDPDNEVFLSAVSVWEILVKHRLGRLSLPDPCAPFIQRQRQAHAIASLPLDEDAVVQLPALPDRHRDPFDRMLVCQAVAHGLILLTPDEAIRRYPIRTLW